jgi:regulator of sigma E protease
MIGKTLGDLFTGNASPRNLGGPLAIGRISGEAARLGLEPFLRWMALLSVNLAVFNLLPIPVLDGGQLLFILVEAVRGRPLSVENRMRLAQLGLILVVGLMVWVIANDILRGFGI